MLAWPGARDCADRALERFSRGRYQYPKPPMTRPVTQVQIHHLTSGRRLSRKISKTMSAMAHPAVTAPVTT